MIGTVQDPEVYHTMYRQGKLGTPANPDRGNSAKHAFWAVYTGHRTPSDYRNTLVYAAAQAGAQLAQQNQAQELIAFNTTSLDYNPNMALDLTALRDDITIRAYDEGGRVRDAALAEVVRKINDVLFRGYRRR